MRNAPRKTCRAGGLKLLPRPKRSGNRTFYAGLPLHQHPLSRRGVPRAPTTANPRAAFAVAGSTDHRRCVRRTLNERVGCNMPTPRSAGSNNCRRQSSLRHLPAKPVWLSALRSLIMWETSSASRFVRGAKGNIADYRTEKIRSARSPSPMKQRCVTYGHWQPPHLGFTEHREVLSTAVRSITHVGWGVDLVVADVSILDKARRSV